MGLTVEYFRKKRDSSKTKNPYVQKRKRQQLEAELMRKLTEVLKDNEEVKIEIDDRYIDECLEILSTPLIKNTYTYEQVSNTQFIFKPKEVVL